MARGADKQSLFLRVTPRGLVPVSSYDAEVIGRYPFGAVVEAILHEPKSEKQARLLWRICGIVADNTDYPDSEAVMIDLKLKAGHYRSISLHGGGFHAQPKSLTAFDKTGLNEFFEECMRIISRDMIPGLDTDRLKEDGLIVLGRSA
jgi:hypothetical protein